MKHFIARHSDRIIGVLNGFDRLVFRGTLRRISFADGLMNFLWKRQVLLKDFAVFAEATTKSLREASETEARRLGRPVMHLPSSRTDKEKLAERIVKQDGISQGLIAVLTCVEPCMTFDIHRNREAKRLQLVSRLRKCLHLYHYWIHPLFGFMHGRIQSWFPFSIQVCLNGREWLARQMDQAGIAYKRRDNCFTWIQDLQAAQKLMDQQLTTAWPEQLTQIARALNPAHERIFKDFQTDYYWSAWQSEWASDLMFKSCAALASIYPPLVLHGITSFSSPDVMRFLGRKIRSDFQGEIVSDFKDRPEGVRIKHRAGVNSVKLYDKQGSVLRAETTMNDPGDFKVFRPKEGDPNGKPAWRQLRRGIADLHRRAQVAQACNERYLDAFAEVDTATPFGELLRQVCQHTSWKGQRVRALRPWAEPDLSLLRSIARGEFHLNGFRNRDLQGLLYSHPARDQDETRSRSSRVTRLLRLLRAHGLIKKVPSTHRYKLTRLGSQLIPTVLAVQTATLQRLQAAA